MGEDSKSAPWASTTRVGSELRPGKGSHGHSASGPAPPGPAPPPPLRLQAPAPPQVVDTKDDRCLPAGTATVLRGASLSRSEQWRRLSRGPGAVTGVGGRRRRGPSPRPPPPTGREAENSSSLVATRRGARDGCGEGAARRRTGADDDGDRRGLCGPAPESGLSAALASSQPWEGKGRPPLTPMLVSCCLHPCATFLVQPAAPLRLLACSPPRLCLCAATPARPPPRPPCAEGMGPAAARRRCGKPEGMGNERLRGKRKGRRFLDRHLSPSPVLAAPPLRGRPLPRPRPRSLWPPRRLANLNGDRNT